jgi:hypothetical protein
MGARASMSHNQPQRQGHAIIMDLRRHPRSVSDCFCIARDTIIDSMGKIRPAAEPSTYVMNDAQAASESR